MPKEGIFHTSIASKVSPGCVFPPFTGWEYRNSKNNDLTWENDDRSLILRVIYFASQTVKAEDSQEMPTSLVFTVSDPKDMHSSYSNYLGRFDITTEFDYKKSAVFKRPFLLDTQMLFRAQNGTWCIGPFFNQINSKLRNKSGKVWDSIPGSKGWEFRDWATDQWVSCGESMVMTPIYSK